MSRTKIFASCKWRRQLNSFCCHFLFATDPEIPKNHWWSSFVFKSSCLLLVIAWFKTIVNCSDLTSVFPSGFWNFFHGFGSLLMCRFRGLKQVEKLVQTIRPFSQTYLASFWNSERSLSLITCLQLFENGDLLHNRINNTKQTVRLLENCRRCHHVLTRAETSPWWSAAVGFRPRV